MRTKDEFIRRWRYQLGGLALFGIASDVKDGVLKRAASIMDVPAEVENLLGRMWDDLQPSTNNGLAKPPAANIGRPTAHR